MIRRLAPLLALALATTAIANPPNETKRTLRMSIEGASQILSIPYVSVDVHSAQSQTNILGNNQESGWAIGSRNTPVTMTFDFALAPDEDGSTLKLQLNRGRQIFALRAFEETPIDEGHVSVYTYRVTGGLVADLKLSGKPGAMKGTLKITCDRVDMTKGTSAVSHQ